MSSNSSQVETTILILLIWQSKLLLLPWRLICFIYKEIRGHLQILKHLCEQEGLHDVHLKFTCLPQFWNFNHYDTTAISCRPEPLLYFILSEHQVSTFAETKMSTGIDTIWLVHTNNFITWKASYSTLTTDRFQLPTNVRKRRKNTSSAGKGKYFPTYLFKSRKAKTVNTCPCPILMVMLNTKYIPLKTPGMSIDNDNECFHLS